MSDGGDGCSSLGQLSAESSSISSARNCSSTAWPKLDESKIRGHQNDAAATIAVASTKRPPTTPDGGRADAGQSVNNKSASDGSSGSGSSSSANKQPDECTSATAERGSGCSSATDNRSSSSNSNSCSNSTTTTTTNTSTTSGGAGGVGGRSRAGSSTTSMSKFKEKRPEPLKLNHANLAGGMNQEIPLDLSVKSAGFVPSGYLGNIFNNLAAAAAAAASAGNQTNHMTTLETPRIVWQDDALLVKQRLFSSSISASSQHRLRLSSLAGDSPPMTPGTPLLDGAVASPTSMMVCSPISQTAAAAVQQQQQQLNRRPGHNFLSPLFSRQQLASHLSQHLRHQHNQNQHHLHNQALSPTKPLSASYAVSRHSSQPLQSGLNHSVSSRFQYSTSQSSGTTSTNKQQQQQRPSDNDEQKQKQYQAVLDAATAAAELHSPFGLKLASLPGSYEAYLRAPRRSCSTENLTGSLLATNRNSLLLSASDHHNQQRYNQQQQQQHHSQRAAAIELAPPSSESSRDSTGDTKGEQKRQLNNCFSYSGQQIAAAAAESLAKSQSPVINVIEGSPSSGSNDDTRDSNSLSRSSGGGATAKALTPTSVANATANLLNIRLNSPSVSAGQQQQLDTDPLISAAYCREQRDTSWSSAHDIRSIGGRSGLYQSPLVTSSGGGVGGASLSSISTTLNTPTLISPSHFKGGSTCFLASPTLSPMSSVFELPSPLLMFPPPLAAAVTSAASPATSSPSVATTSASTNTNRLQVQNNQLKVMSDPGLSTVRRTGGGGGGGGDDDDEPMLLDHSNQLTSYLADEQSQEQPKASSDLALSAAPVASIAAQAQVERQQQQPGERHLNSVSEGNLTHLVTCAREKLGQSADNDEDDEQADGGGAIAADVLNDVANNDDDNDDHDDHDDDVDNGDDDDDDDDDESMDIDLQPQSVHQHTNYLSDQPKQQGRLAAQVVRPATTIPRILVSDCLVQQQQQQQSAPVGNGWAVVSVGQDRFQRQTVPKRALSPQSLRAHINIYHRERLESSSAPPDIYQGKATPKLKCVTGAGSSIDFHANSWQNNHQAEPTTNSTFGALAADQARPRAPVTAASSADHRRVAANQSQPPTLCRQQQQQSHRPAGVIAAASNGHAPSSDWPNRSSSVDPLQMMLAARSSTGPAGGHPEAAGGEQCPEARSPIRGILSHSVQQLGGQNGYAGGAQTTAGLILQAAHSQQQQQQQSLSAGELHRSAQIHQSGPAISNQRAMFQPTTTSTLLTGNQSMASTHHHHNQPFGLAHHPKRPAASDGPASGIPDHSPGELFHQQSAGPTQTVGACIGIGLSSASIQQPHHHSQSAAQGQQPRAASACSLSYNPMTSYHQHSLHLHSQQQQQHQHHHQQQPQQHHQQHPHPHQHHHPHLHHHPHTQQPNLSQHQHEQQQQQQLQLHHQLEGFSGLSMASVTPAPTTSFRSNSVAGSNVSAGQQQQIAAAAAAAKKYRCDDCSKAFTRSDMLTRHKRLHSGDRPFQCNECKQEFSRSDHLSTHMRTHTGEKPYRCKLCSYSACRKDMITRHMKVHNRSSPSAAPPPPTSTSAAAVSAPTLLSTGASTATLGHHGNSPHQQQ